MKKILLFIISFYLSISCGAQRRIINLDRDWKFHYGDIDGAEVFDIDDSDWVAVNLPHDFQIWQEWIEPDPDEKSDMDNAVANVSSRLSSRGFKEMGSGWYRRKLVADSAWRGKRVLLDFGGIMLTGDVYVNGLKVGGTDYGYLGFETDITPLLDYNRENLIAVRADTGRPENSRWYTGGGLYRDVKLVITPADRYFTRHPISIVTPSVTDSLATVITTAEIGFSDPELRKISVKTLIYAPDGKLMHENVVSLPCNRRQKIKEYRVDSIGIANPHLWDCDSPSLYITEIAILDDNGKIVDRVEQKFGIRSIEYSPEFGFKLNGKKVLFKGIANHHTLGALGAAAFPRAIEKRIKLLKSFGFNHIRTSHNPYSEDFLDLCDRYGILVVDELYDKWLTQYAGGRRDWMEQWPRDIPEWIKRDRNHPSVVMWSLGNELQLLWEIPFADWGVTPYRMQKALLDRYDVTRPVTVAMHPRGRHETTDSLPAPLVMETDIAAYNYRYMYFPGDGRRFPWLTFYQSEANASGMGPNFFDMDLNRVVGLAYWGMIDYLGESSGWPAKGWTQGVFDISLEPKPAAWFLKSFFLPDVPVLHIAVAGEEDATVWNDVRVGTTQMTDHWNFKDGKKLRIFTFTNADEVELKVNGRSLGRKRNDKSDSGHRNRIEWIDVPYSPGQIEAFGFMDGNASAVSQHRIETAETAVRLIAESDNQEWKADGMDLIHITVTAVDSKGLRNPEADDQVTFTVSGPAEIAGVVNGCLMSDEAMTGNSRRLYNGRVTVILRSTDVAGEVTLTAATLELMPTKLTLNTVF